MAWWATRIVETARCGVIRLDFPGYVFPTVNQLMRIHWAKRSKLAIEAYHITLMVKNMDRAADAKGRRRVSMSIARPNGRPRDPDSSWKIALDALVQANLLIDDSPKYCVLGEFTQTRGPLKTVITLEDIDGR